MLLRPLLAFAALLAPLPLAAEDPAERMISAERPDDLVFALLNAGYDPKLLTDGIGDPAISFSRAEGYPLMVLFYDCDEETHDKCTAIQLRGGLDRAEPWNPAEAIEISSRYRFLAVSLDEEGDPWMTWDILTGSGIPESLFVEAVERFEATLEEAADALVFAEERAAKTGVEESAAGDASE
jgi:hypothetical protein